MLVHYYKTKCEVSGDDAPWNFLTSLNQIQNDRKSAIIYLDWLDITGKPCQIGRPLPGYWF